MIPQYLGAQPPEALGIPGARVTHVWCEDTARANHIARTCLIERVARKPEDVIGQVDAVIIPTDIGEEHLERARSFIEADLPVFIDKPLTTDAAHLAQFIRWQQAGKIILSTSSMRYAREFADLRSRLNEVGTPRLITITMPKSWERYGIHALESIYSLLEPDGWISAANSGDGKTNIVHLRHRSGVEAVIASIDDLYGCFARTNVYGTSGSIAAAFSGTFFAFNAQLVSFVEMLRTGKAPFDFAETVEQMKIIIAGTRSRQEGGRTVKLSEINL